MEYKARLRGLWRIISSKTIISVMVIVVTVGCSTFGKTESTAQRVGHRSGAAFAEDDARASRSNASRFAAHMFEVLCTLGVSAVRFCSKVKTAINPVCRTGCGSKALGYAVRSPPARARVK
jgi:hypothetical protein